MATTFSSLVAKFNEKKHTIKQSAVNNKRHSTLQTIIGKKTPFTITEAYKTARTNILFALAGSEKCKKIIFTSAEPGEGKTTTVLNMAITFAQTDAKVLVIDGDMRKPRVHRYLALEKNDGLSELLAGLIDKESAVKHCEEKGVDCITAGKIPPNPVELLSSDNMVKVLEYFSNIYDYIFIDTPPVTVVTDAASMAKFVDGYIVVIRHNYTIHEFLTKAREALLFAEAKILGYVMNDLKAMGGIGYGKYGNYNTGYNRYRYRYKYGYKYGYGYGSGYGYSYGYKYGDSHNNFYSDEYVYGDPDDEDSEEELLTEKN